MINENYILDEVEEILPEGLINLGDDNHIANMANFSMYYNAKEAVSGNIPTEPFDAAASISKLANMPIPPIANKPIYSSGAQNSDLDNSILQKLFIENPGLKSFSKPEDYLIQDASGKMGEILKKNKFSLEFQGKGQTDYEVGDDKMKLDNSDKNRIYINPESIKPEQREEAIKLDIISHAFHNHPEYNNFTKDLEQKLTDKYGKKMVEGNGGVDAYIRGYLSNSKEYQPYKEEMKFLPPEYFKKLDKILKSEKGGDNPKSMLLDLKFGNWTGQTDTKVMAKDLQRRGLVGADQLIEDQPDVSSADSIKNSQSDWKITAIQHILENAHRLNIRKPEEFDANIGALTSTLDPKYKEALKKIGDINPNFYNVIKNSILPEQWKKFDKQNNLTAKK